MITAAEVIAIYATFGIELGSKKQTAEQMAKEDVAHATSDGCTTMVARRRIEGYTRQESCERQGDANEAREFEMDRAFATWRPLAYSLRRASSPASNHRNSARIHACICSTRICAWWNPLSAR